MEPMKFRREMDSSAELAIIVCRCSEPSMAEIRCNYNGYSLFLFGRLTICQRLGVPIAFPAFGLMFASNGLFQQQHDLCGIRAG